ncbi:hypothetical protein FOPG_08272 [Fusarium oxysporum f. sp. conglutinans race 2 54008]|uniref:Uncharacterized protein n=1 Tax=Fusarium oxysporum f. sp. conglutinans race 2 54008 TaxID=1089457 RepID=X0IWB6_FUSOX|nr:hypothetical protein FOPG_08272 [Fusarium oxysporum f. sp. conglutinans race 2 54008]
MGPLSPDEPGASLARFACTCEPVTFTASPSLAWGSETLLCLV